MTSTSETTPQPPEYAPQPAEPSQRSASSRELAGKMRTKAAWNKAADQPTITPLGRADLHMHSHYSDGLGTVQDILTFVGQRGELDVIAITDHDTIEGALRARELGLKQENSLEVIVGEEVSTREGHLLALFIEERIPSGLSIEQSIALVHEQGGIAVIAHPFNRVFRHSTQLEVVERLKHAPLEAQPDGIETLNGSFAGIGSSHLAMTRNRRRYGWPETGSSDAHTVTAIGCAFTWFEGSSADDLRRSLLGSATMPGGRSWQTQDYWKLASYWARNGRPGHPTYIERLRQLGQSNRLASLRLFSQIARRPLVKHLPYRGTKTQVDELDHRVEQEARIPH